MSENKRSFKQSKILLLFTFFFFAHSVLFAQVQVDVIRNLNFGTIIIGNNGGTATISPDGSRNTTGNVYFSLSGTQGNEAVFEINSNPNEIINVVFGNAIISKGSYSLRVHLGPSDPIAPFRMRDKGGKTVNLHLGGTLFIGNKNQVPEGVYNGTFTVTFIEE